MRSVVSVDLSGPSLRIEWDVKENDDDVYTEYVDEGITAIYEMETDSFIGMSFEGEAYELLKDVLED
jgi:hypothetical protein